MTSYRIRPRTVERIQRGEALILLKDFYNEDRAQHLQEGTLVDLIDDRKRYIATMLVGRQNKGMGWVISRHQEDWSPSLVRFILEEAFEERADLMADSLTTAFRLFNGEGDGIGGLTIDWYQGYVLITTYSQGIDQYLNWFAQAIESLLPDLQGIYVTKRYPLQENDPQIGHLSGEVAPSPWIIKESGMQFATYLGEDWMTGIFLDQRDVRSFVRDQSQGLNVLNLFSYTGAFSVPAALGGAATTVSVDVANRSLERTREQFLINDIEPDEAIHQIRVMDVFDYLQYAQRHQMTFDFVICDPPSFARTKRRTFAARDDYASLARELFAITAPGGMCLLSCNHSAYSMDAFRQDMIDVAQTISEDFYLIQQFGLPEDFPTSADPTSDYLKICVFYRSE